MGNGDFFDDIFNGFGFRFLNVGVGYIVNCLVVYYVGFYCFFFFWVFVDVFVICEQGVFLGKNGVFMGKVQVWQFYVFYSQVYLYIQFCLVVDGEDVEVFFVVFFIVEEVLEFWVLIFGVLLFKFVVVGEEVFFGMCFFFVFVGIIEGCIEFVFFQFFEQDMGLQVVMVGVVFFFFCDSVVVYGFLYGVNNQVGICFFDQFILVFDCFWEVVFGIYM